MTERYRSPRVKTEFEYPTEERWGLTPDEQVLLFGDQGPYDKYSPDAFWISFRKFLLSIQYLVSFWPRDEVPEQLMEYHRQNLAMRREAGVGYPPHPVDEQELAREHPLSVATRLDLLSTYDRDRMEKPYAGIGEQVVERTLQASQADPDPQAAQMRLDYILKLINDQNEFGWRGDMRSGSGAWAELPDAPWKCDMTEYPIHLIDGIDGRLF